MHEKWMRRALDLARMAEGQTSPNPMVGAVIVKEGVLLGEGFHHKAGGPHAEIEALRGCTASPRGARIYVSLEPCCHYGRTPPCAKALIEAGIAEVYYAVPDVNPQVAGGGHRMLEAAGIVVHQGPLEAEGRFLNRAFFRYIGERRCHVSAKFAMSLDGKIATQSGESKWITGPAARAEVMEQRWRSDAILVGIGTVLADNPELTARVPNRVANHPLRVVLDSQGRIPLDARLLSSALPGKSLIATTARFPHDKAKLLQERGIEILVLEANSKGQVDLLELTRELAKRACLSLMVEGGSQVLGGFLEAGLIDEVWAYIAPRLIGGTQALGPIGGEGIGALAQTPAFEIVAQRMFGPDLFLQLMRKP